MAKRKSSLILSEFVPEGQKTESGPSIRVREFSPEVHIVLMRLAREYGAKYGLELEPVAGVFGTGNRSEFKVHLKKFGTYFTQEEFTHLAEYLRGAADALERQEEDTRIAAAMIESTQRRPITDTERKKFQQSVKECYAKQSEEQKPQG